MDRQPIYPSIFLCIFTNKFKYLIKLPNLRQYTPTFWYNSSASFILNQGMDIIRKGFRIEETSLHSNLIRSSLH